ncbi:B3 domain-containing protein REM16-like isoform X1 [Coffea arabica]|nr:B3 domain-containing protein REM16-like [Coffea arabica]
MGDDGRACRKWEEEIYWSHFQSAQFFQTLSGRNYRNQLAIPQKFANNLKEKLVGAVSLKGPSGLEWKAGLTMIDDTLYLKEGWKKFVVDHSLKENDVLIFKYVGASRFDVLMFDYQSLCEKESSYFIKRCENGGTDGGCKRKDNPTETIEVTNEASHDVSESTPSKRPRKHGALPPRSRGRQRGTCSSINRSVFSGPASHRRQVTEEDKDEALKMACASASENSFIVVMRPTHVYRGFYLQIPSEWATKYMPNRSQDLTLQVKDKTWKVRFYKRDYRTGGLAGGWKRFVHENFLEEFDVCLFNLVTGAATDDIVMDVSIFKVVEGVIPVTRLPPINLKGRKPMKI